MMLSRLRQWLRPAPRRPFQLIQIEPSLQCSLRCVMCPWSEMRGQAGHMQWETFERLLPYLELAQGVDFTGGGEPTANPRLVEMVQAAKAAGCETGFSTNGFKLTPELSQALLESGLDWISFSVDAATAEMYERIRQGARFQTVLDNIRALRDLKAARGLAQPRLMMVFVMMTGAQENYHELPAFIDLAHELGVEQVIAKNLDVILKEGDDERRLFSHTGPAPDAVEAVLAEAQARAAARKIGLRLYRLQPQEQPICEHNPLRSVFINWEGRVSPCITLAYAGERYFDGEHLHVPCLRFGDVAQQPLPDVWDSTPYRSFRQSFARRVQAQQQALLDALIDHSGDSIALPPAPEGCRTCYYLYGV